MRQNHRESPTRSQLYIIGQALQAQLLLVFTLLKSGTDSARQIARSATRRKSFSCQIGPAIGRPLSTGLGVLPAIKSGDEEETCLCVDPVRRRARLLFNRRKCASTQTSFGTSCAPGASGEPLRAPAGEARRASHALPCRARRRPSGCLVRLVAWQSTGHGKPQSLAGPQLGVSRAQ